MKFLLFIGILVIIFAQLALADNGSKVKVIQHEPLTKSTEYFGTQPFLVEIIKVNETYNRINVDTWIVKDFPLNTEYRAEVSRSSKSNSKCGEYQKVCEYPVSICSHNNDEYDAYLPELYRAFKESGKCPMKGHFQTDDDQGFEFYNLLTEEQLKNACFKVINRFASANVDFLVDELRYVTND